LEDARFSYCPNLIKSAQILPKFCSNLPKYRPNLINFAPKSLLEDAAAYVALLA